MEARNRDAVRRNMGDTYHVPVCSIYYIYILIPCSNTTSRLAALALGTHNALLQSQPLRYNYTDSLELSGVLECYSLFCRREDRFKYILSLEETHFTPSLHLLAHDG